MMIGGVDILLDTSGLDPAKVLESVARVTRQRWPNSVLVDPLTSTSFAEAPFGLLKELFVFRDAAARASWETLGPEPENRYAMLYAIVRAQCLTLIVEDPQTPFARAAIAELSALFGSGNT